DALDDLAGGPRGGIELDAGVAVAFDEALYRKKQVDPHGLRAGIAAPGAPDGRGDQKEPDARHHEQAGNVDEFLRPDLDEEEIKTPVGEVHQHGLVGRVGATIPANPRREI